jgi:predicted nuclease of restriction endonuclease-like (RecB) superfamily
MNKNTELINYTDAIKAIKLAILRSRYRTAVLANKEMLSLYFGIGKYVSDNSRKGFWGTGAVEQISEGLQKELPGLRGFSATNIKRMRSFHEEWAKEFNQIETDNSNRPIASVVNRPSVMDDFQQVENKQIIIHPLITDEFTADIFDCFVRISFTHHSEIINKAKSKEERIFYIQKAATEFWTVEKLLYNLFTNFREKIIHIF